MVGSNIPENTGGRLLPLARCNSASNPLWLGFISEIDREGCRLIRDSSLEFDFSKQPVFDDDATKPRNDVGYMSVRTESRDQALGMLDPLIWLNSLTETAKHICEGFK